jgi:hypothetical protein
MIRASRMTWAMQLPCMGKKEKYVLDKNMVENAK